MIRTLVTGANGQVGSEIRYLAAEYPKFDFIFTDYKELDITDEAAVLKFFSAHQIDYCINCAAYTKVDKAEFEVVNAHKVNVKGIKNLAVACQQYQVPLIHLSSDYVYHSDQNTPLKEDDATEPKSVYARTKLEGELLAQSIHPRCTIVRTSWVYSSFGKNFVKTMLRLGQERQQLQVVYDQIGAPTYARPLAKAILSMIKKIAAAKVSASKASGIFHYSNEGVTSWYDFARAIFELEDMKIDVLPIETKDYPTPALRPHFSLLDKTKIKTTFNIEIPHWRDSLKACLQALKVEV
ncbi:MAG: dTDP-4-dehydrorhamnose reductase [Bacteroidota bacterium]